LGAIHLIIYTNTNQTKFDSECINKFLQMKPRGPDNTVIFSESTLDISKIKQQQPYLLKSKLTKSEIGNYTQYNFLYGNHRLAINDTTLDGNQPFNRPSLYNTNLEKLNTETIKKLICNGEIYNYPDLKTEPGINLNSECDVEIILELYNNFVNEKVSDTESKYTSEEALNLTLSKLNGDFAFILSDNLNTIKLSEANLYVARDPLGMKPVYVIKRNFDYPFYIFTSELKSVPDNILKDNINYSVMSIPNGSYWSFNKNIIQRDPLKYNLIDEFTVYHNFDKFLNISNLKYPVYSPQNTDLFYKDLNSTLRMAVQKRIQNILNLGVLFSAGIDSCVILSIIIEYYIDNNLTENLESLNVFTLECQSMQDFPAKRYIDFLNKKYNLNLNHYTINIPNDTQSIIDSIEPIINIVETYEPELIKDSIPFYFLFNWIRTFSKTNVVISGDCMDEHGGYIDFNDLSDSDFQLLNVKLINSLSKFDLMRTERMSANNSLEIRHPYLDINFVELFLGVCPYYKRDNKYDTKSTIEKYYFRNCFKDFFDESVSDLLWCPMKSVSEAFPFINAELEKYYSQNYSDDYFETYISDVNRWKTFVIPKTKEEMAYQVIYNKLFPNRGNLLKSYWSGQVE
jgi:asparagine synthase (glutamine-hydrolysing)